MSTKYTLQHHKPQPSSQYQLTPTFHKQNPSSNFHQINLINPSLQNIQLANKQSNNKIFSANSQPKFQPHFNNNDINNYKQNIHYNDHQTIPKNTAVHLIKHSNQDNNPPQFILHKNGNVSINQCQIPIQTQSNLSKCNTVKSYTKMQQKLLSKINKSKIPTPNPNPNKHSNNSPPNQQQPKPSQSYNQYNNPYFLNRQSLQSNNNNTTNKKLINFPQQKPQLLSPNHQQKQKKYSTTSSHYKNYHLNIAQPQYQIHIHDTLIKPKFGFKNNNNVKNIQQPQNNQDQLISFQTSNNSQNSLTSSKSMSNFNQILRMSSKKYKIKHINENKGQYDKYLINKIDNKQQNLTKKLQQQKKHSQYYTKKIKQKQMQINIIKKLKQKQQKQLLNYQSKFNSAYHNINSNVHFLLVNSHNSSIVHSIHQQRIKNKTVINCQFYGISKQMFKQILYSQCMIFQSDLIQIGFNNRTKKIVQLYFIVKENLLSLQSHLQNAKNYGFQIEENFNLDARNVVKGNQIKCKIIVDYQTTSQNLVGFMVLKINMKTINNVQISESVTLPFCLYRNFIDEVEPKMQVSSKHTKASQLHKSKSNPTLLIHPEYYHLVTQFQNSSEQLIRNPKSYLQTLFKSGKWIEQNIYHIDLILKGLYPKSMNILINYSNFALQIADLKNLDVVSTVGNLLARAKQQIKKY